MNDIRFIIDANVTNGIYEYDLDWIILPVSSGWPSVTSMMQHAIGVVYDTYDFIVDITAGL